MRELLEEVERLVAAKLPCAYCTVVATRGSTPQKPGAAMLVRSDGTQAGTLGGGCVEAEVRQRALHALAANQVAATIHSFMLDDDFGWDDGLICGGRMTILVDPVSAENERYFHRLRTLHEARTAFFELVALPDNAREFAPGGRVLIDTAGRVLIGFGLQIESLQSFADLVGHTQPAVVNGLAILPTLSRMRLLIVGGGHVGQAVAKLATECDFDVWVIDDREKFASAERFPTASRRIVGEIGAALKDLAPQFDTSTYCLIVTRGHSHDEEALFHLASTQAGYVGMIGSKRKVRLIYDDLRARGITEDALARVRAPVGIEIGSQTVPEIAVSIVAELIARRSEVKNPPVATGGLESKE